MEKMRRFTFARFFLAIVLFSVFAFLEAVLYNGKIFYETLDDFSGSISRADQLSAKANLQNLKYFYELNKKLKPLGLNDIVNQYFFEDALHYQSAYDYLTGNYDKIVDHDLKNDDSYWGRFIRANAKWRQAQGIFAGSLNKNKDEKTRADEQKQAIESAVSTKDDYEQAIKEDKLSTLPPKWNYDLTTDPAAMARALAPKPLKIKIMLGEGGDKDKNPGNKEGNSPGKGTLDLDRKNGNKPGQNSNPGTKREG